MIGLSFVAFVDILGFGEMVIADYESATPGEVFLPRLKSAIHEALSQAHSVDAKIVQISDSIVISSPFSTIQEDFKRFLDLVRGLQFLLFKNGILCRGGISHGRHFHDETLLFSQALIEAYMLESRVARDPRIIISSETLSLLFLQGSSLGNVLIDGDGQTFIDYMSLADSGEIEELMASHRQRLLDKDANIRSKIAWLFRCASLCHDNFALPENIEMRKPA